MRCLRCCPFLTDSFSLSYTLAAGLMLASAASSSLIQPLFGLWSDRHGASWLLPTGVAIAGVGIALAAAAPSYWLVLVFVVISGLGVAAFHPEGSKFAAYASGSKRASGMSAFAIGGNIGFALGPIIATPLVLWLGLRGGLLLALPPLAIAVTLFALLPFLRTFVPDRSVVRRVGGADRPGALSILLAVIGFRSLAWWGLLTFVPLWEVSLGHSKAYGNHLLALMLLVGGLGTIAVGPLADRFGRRPVLVVSLRGGGAADPCIRGRRRRGGRGCARAHGNHRGWDVRLDDGDVAGVPAAAHRTGLGFVDRVLDRPRRCRRARPGRACRRGRPSGGSVRERGRAARGACVDAAACRRRGLDGSSSPRSQSRSRVRAMAESTREFFEGLPARADASKLAGMNNSYVFDIEGSGTWFVAVQDGAISVRDGEGEADCTISTTEENFQKILSGEQNATSAYMTGKLKIKGDMGAAMKLQKLF